jgi:hypothetical protein
MYLKFQTIFIANSNEDLLAARLPSLLKTAN